MEQTKKCRECLADIPKQARKCSHCGSKQPSKVLQYAGYAILGLFLIGMYQSTMSTVSNSSPSTYTPPAPVSTFELGTYIVEADDFDLMEANEVNLWQSFSNRQKVGAVSRGDVVEVISQDPTNDYCKVSAEEQTGWLACGWLVKQ